MNTESFPTEEQLQQLDQAIAKAVAEFLAKKQDDTQ